MRRAQVLSITVTCPTDATEVVIGLLASHGFEALQVTAEGDTAKLQLCVPPEAANSDLMATLAAELNQLPSLLPELPAKYLLKTSLEEQPDWTQEWRNNYKPVTIGRIQIVPRWLAGETPLAPDEVRLLLDPGEAFGTGLHESTQLPLRMMQELDLRGARVLDLGTGSGVLSLAAVKLGAREVVARDVDPTALRVALENASINGVAKQVSLGKGSLYEGVEGLFNCILCNITAEWVLQAALHAATFLQPGGAFLGSGFYAYDAGPIVDALRAANFSTSIEQQGEWSAVKGLRAKI